MPELPHTHPVSVWRQLPSNEQVDGEGDEPSGHLGHCQAAASKSMHVTAGFTRALVKFDDLESALTV